MHNIELEPLEKAITQLQAGFDKMRFDPADDLRRDGVIQRFEYTMDLAWKILQRFLKEHFQSDPNKIKSKNDIFRESARLGLVKDAEAWIGHYAARNDTSHDYNQEKADEVFERVKLFLPDVHNLLETLRHVD
jgi:nucleotidyltransferase substrate binding protein (TIGR01987 family)